MPIMGNFLATEKEVRRTLRGWRFPLPLLAEPREVHGTNPFSKQPMVFRTRVPPRPKPRWWATANPELSRFEGYAVAPTRCATCYEPFLMYNLGFALRLWGEDDRLQLGNQSLVGPSRTKHMIQGWPRELVNALCDLGPDRAGEVVEHMKEGADDCSKELPWRRGWLDTLASLAARAVRDGRDVYDFFVLDS